MASRKIAGKDSTQWRKGGGGRGGGVGWVRHGSCRGFRCARPKIRQEMRREDGKKRTICQDWSETPQSHKPGMTRGEIRGKRGLQRTEGSEIGWRESGKCDVSKVSACNFPGLVVEPKDVLLGIRRYFGSLVCPALNFFQCLPKI